MRSLWQRGPLGWHELVMCFYCPALFRFLEVIVGDSGFGTLGQVPGGGASICTLHAHEPAFGASSTRQDSLGLAFWGSRGTTGRDALLRRVHDLRSQARFIVWWSESPWQQLHH